MPSYKSLYQKSVSLLVFMATLLISKGLLASSLPDFTQLAADNGPSVVNISTSRKTAASPFEGMDIPKDNPFGDLFKHFFGEQFDKDHQGNGMPEEKAQSLGSGFIISNDGYILTNHHVIKGADEIIVRLHDKRSLVAKLIGSDRMTDVAVLKIDAKNLNPVKIGDASELKVGEWVLAIGSPYGFDHSVTAGIVSAKGRSLPRDVYVPFIQTDVAINPGNSGGPLFNMNGEVVGVNSQIYTNTGGFMGLSFSIPIEVAMDVVSQIKKSGHVTRGWLGVYIQEISRELAESFGLDRPQGALVSQVIEDSPAQKFGIKAGDVILKFNGKAVTDSNHLPALVGRVAVGTKVKVEVLRDKKIKVLYVVIAALKDEKESVIAPSAPDKKFDRIGLLVSAAESKQGVVITAVEPKSAAAITGMRKNDVILMLNHKKISSVSDYKKIMKQLPVNKSIPVLIMRDGGRLFHVLKLKD
ncbi:MAG: DegQ family serine endoprotease [Gammaproteobacteria bacterium]|nr:DegQ family serine endoprotease [Gammaproteobacteria bacterium]